MFLGTSLGEAQAPGNSALASALRVGLVGTGVVGSGTCQVLKRNADLIAQRAGRPIEIRMVCARNLDKAAQVVGEGIALTRDPFLLVRHPDLDVIVEVIGGVGLAKELMLEAIAHGKHVVTANKALLAEHGDEIFAAAQARGVVVAYEAAVAVSIPIIKALREGLAANRIHEVVGIVNGTSNFILSKMQEDGLEFEAALQLATELGYAEADPTFDVDGRDAAHKMALLAANAFGAEVPFGRVHTQGIRGLELWDMLCAQALGHCIKLLGVAKHHGDAIEVSVRPALVRKDHFLAQVHGAMNGIWVNADAAGPTFHYGAGAGSQTTASAVIADLIDVARCSVTGSGAPVFFRVPHRSVQASAVRRWPMVPFGQVLSRHCLRFEVRDDPLAPFDVLVCLQAHGIPVQQHACLVNPQTPDLKTCVALTASLRRDALDASLSSMARMHPGLRPAAVWQVQDLA